MIGTFKKIWEFSGEERGNINKSVAVSFLNAVFHMFEIGAIYFVVMALTNGDKDMKTVWISLAFMVVSIIGNAVTSRFSKLQQTHAGYFMAANRRVSIGNRLKSVPMGFFNENSLGEVTGVCTTVLGNIENLVPMTLVNILGGVIGTVVFTIMILIFDWRIGLIAAAGIIVYLLVVSSMEKKSAVIAPNSQKSQTALVETVLEYVQGMGVIKSFNLSGRGDKNLQDALEYNRKSNLGMEQLMTPYTIFQELVLQIAGIGMMLAAVVFWINGTMTLVNTLMVIIMSFLVFGQIKLFGMGISMLRLADSSIERTLQTEDMEQMDESGKALAVKKHDIVFDDVHFAYESKEILHGINLQIPDKTTTAVIGPSGSGKTTLCNLIARFWDVQQGKITVGGKDIKSMEPESLMSYMSFVFQDVTLFNDTVMNNIRLGNPNATDDQVIAAAKAAYCDEFVREMPDGYQTVLGENGSTLSGGERQRISIARALLKNAPIILLDEATASLDPENEILVQKAIAKLVEGKTVIMIAHRLRTVVDSDQILVLDNGRLVEHGTHDALMKKNGLYHKLFHIQQESLGWAV